MRLIQKRNLFHFITWAHAAIGILLLVWHLMGDGIPMKWQVTYFIVMIAMTGIPHGALDHVIAKANAEREKKPFSIQLFLSRYLIATLAYGLCWAFFPSVSLLVFLLISAWHFGETDIAAAGSHPTWNLARFTWGSFVLLLILLSHQSDTTLVMERITQNSPVVLRIWEMASAQYVSIILTMAILSVLMIFIAMRQQSTSISLFQALNLALILLLCTQLPLLPSFALYFSGWHAIRSFDIIFRFLNGDKEKEQIAPMRVWKDALPMTFLACFFFIFMAYIWNALGLKADPIPILFVFLSIITLPHLDVMDGIIQKQNTFL
jgi:Brp/Blh family beta-carotene 15,15'-monooxygenase